MAMDLPPDDDPDAIFAFAMSFNGYQHYGSLEASAEAARKAERDSLEALRNELFFSARASRARDDDRYLETYREILPLLRRY
jgi:hypothetical protein